MNFYITVEPFTKLRRSFSNLHRFYIIDVDEMLSNMNVDMNNQGHVFLVNTELKRMLASAAKSKRYNGILYINSRVNEDSILGIKKYIGTLTLSHVDAFVALDDYDVPRMNKYYGFFDEVYFFPSLKKTRIIECKSIQIKQ